MSLLNMKVAGSLGLPEASEHAKQLFQEYEYKLEQKGGMKTMPLPSILLYTQTEAASPMRQ